MVVRLLVLVICFAHFTHMFGSEHVVCREKKILICGVCKDVAKSVPNTICNIEKLGQKFKDYAVIIYENNSKDNTAILFKQWAARNNKVIFMSEMFTRRQLLEGIRCRRDSGEPSRMERIAIARNKTLAIAREKRFDDFDYVIMADLDFKKSWPLEAIVKTIEKGGDWDCVAANGLFRKDIYYDRFAFRDARFPLGPELLDKKWWKEIWKEPLRFTGSRWIPVYSAFGGLAIYKRKSIIPFSYVGYVTDDLKTCYKDIIASLSHSHMHLQKYRKLNGLPVSLSLANTQVIFRENSQLYGFYTCCEHVTLHASMRLNGFGKIYVNPEMKLVYDLPR